MRRLLIALQLLFERFCDYWLIVFDLSVGYRFRGLYFWSDQLKIKKYFQNALRSVGYDLMSLSYSQDYVYDRHLQHVLRRWNISSVLDIGANIGGYGELLRAIGYKGVIHSFEPCSAPFDQLAQAATSDKLWRVHQIGLSDREGSAAINIMAGSELNSVLQPRELSEKMSVIGTELIQMSTLDGLDLPVDWGRTFVKVDTQGHDSAVISGGKLRLQQIPLLQTEISFLPIYQGMSTFAETLSFLTESGFDVLGMFPVSRDDAGRVREFDCLCLNRAFAAPHS